MKKAIALALILSGLSFTNGNMENNKLDNVREVFHRSVSEANIEEVLSIQADGADSEIIKAYQAVSQTMMAEFVVSPFSKFSYFKKGKNQLESIISTNKSFETIYLRLLIQLNVPSMLDYYSKIETDLDYFCTNFESSEIDVQTKELFKQTLLSTAKIGDYPEKKTRILSL